MKKEELTSEFIRQGANIAEDVILYDADGENLISFPVEKKGKTYRVGHLFGPLPDLRYFQFIKELSETIKVLTRELRATVEAYTPQVSLWNDTVKGRTGYVDSPNWKEKTHILEKAGTINEFLKVEVITPDTIESSDLLDDSDDLTEINLNAIQNGVLIGTKHFFREESAAELDEYYAIEANKPKKGVIASGLKQTAAKRYCDLYDVICQNQTGYVSRIPAWHKQAAVTAFFATVEAKAKKFDL